jgi:hypothetical protein
MPKKRKREDAWEPRKRKRAPCNKTNDVKDDVKPFTIGFPLLTLFQENKWNEFNAMLSKPIGFNNYGSSNPHMTFSEVNAASGASLLWAACEKRGAEPSIIQLIRHCVDTPTVNTNALDNDFCYTNRNRRTGVVLFEYFGSPIQILLDRLLQDYDFGIWGWRGVRSFRSSANILDSVNALVVMLQYAPITHDGDDHTANIIRIHTPRGYFAKRDGRGGAEEFPKSVRACARERMWLFLQDFVFQYKEWKTWQEYDLFGVRAIKTMRDAFAKVDERRLQFANSIGMVLDGIHALSDLVITFVSVQPIYRVPWPDVVWEE